MGRLGTRRGVAREGGGPRKGDRATVEPGVRAATTRVGDTEGCHHAGGPRKRGKERGQGTAVAAAPGLVLVAPRRGGGDTGPPWWPPGGAVGTRRVVDTEVAVARKEVATVTVTAAPGSHSARAIVGRGVRAGVGVLGAFPGGSQGGVAQGGVSPGRCFPGGVSPGGVFPGRDVAWGGVARGSHLVLAAQERVVLVVVQRVVQGVEERLLHLHLELLGGGHRGLRDTPPSSETPQRPPGRTGSSPGAA